MASWWTSNAASVLYGALVGGGLSYVTALHTNRSARKDLSARFRHERLLAQEAREYTDRSRCYETLMLEVQRTNAFVLATRPFIGGGEPPPPPTDEDWRKILASVLTFGSTEIQSLLDNWQTSVRQFALRAHTLDTLEKRSVKGASWVQEWNGAEPLLEPARQEALAAAKSIGDQVHGELHPRLNPAPPQGPAGS